MKLKLSDAHQDAVKLYKNFQNEDAQRLVNRILFHFPKDYLANKIAGLIACRLNSFAVSVTYFKNALRSAPQDQELICMISSAIAEMQKAIPNRNIYIIGDSHTDLFVRIDRAVVRWIGPVTMHRVGREADKILNYKNYGVAKDATVISVFGEIDVRAHIMRIVHPTSSGIIGFVDNLVALYVSAVRHAFVNSEARTQIIAGLVPPCSRMSMGGFPVAGTPQQRVELTNAINDRLRFSCQLFGFGYLDQYTPFAADDGTLASQWTDDGLHISRKHTEVLVPQLRAFGV